MARAGANDMLYAEGQGPLFQELEGVVEQNVKICPLTSDNRRIVNRHLPFTRPSAFGREHATLGLGDRLGLCSDAHLQAVKGHPIKPILAQQSIRELTLMHRNYDQVMDAAAWSVLRNGWHEGWGADGDHLKQDEEVAMALRAGCTMITLDCSERLGKKPDQAEAVGDFRALPEDLRERFIEDYLQQTDARGLDLIFTEESLAEIVAVYWPAVEFAVHIWFELLEGAGRAIDYEISLDETLSTTPPAAHYFVANELTKAGVSYTSLAPRFVGEFQKGIDYLGDLDEFSEDFVAHAKIADAFGHKISVHSGSDKFLIFPLVGLHTANRFHLKTAGTSWLEGVRVLARLEPALYRRLHARALDTLEDASAYYQVKADLSKIRPLSSVDDSELPLYLTEEDSRQLLHITYGLLFDDPQLASAMMTAFGKHKSAYDAGLASHIRKHITCLGL
jgi:hypothetical protein